MYDLITSNPEFLDIPELKIKVRAGTLSIFNHIKDEDAVYITAPKPEFLIRDITLAEIAEAMDLEETMIDKQKPINIIDGGLRTLILPLVSLEGCLLLHPCQEKLKQFCLLKDIDIVLVFTNETSTSSANYRTRVFAPKYGYLEDPATGSGNSAFGYYLISNNDWSGDFTIEQGTSRSCPNIVKIKRYQKGSEDHILFGGNAITRIDGCYCLHEI